MGKLGRNKACHCGSGKKYKKCCLRKDEETRLQEQGERLTELDILRGVVDPFAGDDDWEDEPVEGFEEKWGDDEDFDAKAHDFPVPMAEDGKIPATESKELSDEDASIIDAWWDTYRDMSDPDKLRGHIESIMVSHSNLIVALGLEEEPLFELERMYTRQDRYDAYINVLSRLRSDFPDAYLKGFAHFDNSVITWLVINDHKEQVTEHLANFRRYFAHDPDILFELIHFLMSWNCQAILSDFIPRICNQVCMSPDIIGGQEILSPMTTIIMAPYLDLGLDLGVDKCDAEKLALEIKTLGAMVNPVWTDPEFLKKRIECILGRNEKWSLAGCRTRTQAIECYDELTSNFMGWLAANKGLDWCAAEYHRLLIHDYLTEALPEKKRPREPFPFDEKNMERLLGRLSKKMLWLDSSRLFGLLNGIYWLTEFLEDTLSLDSEQAQRGREACLHLFNQVYPEQRNVDFKARAWKQFPRKNL